MPRLLPSRRITVAAGVLLILVARPAALRAQAACAEDPAYAVLDFWVGEWEVLADGARVGSNRIEKVLSGCAILEHWRSARGSEGKSLFYRVPVEDAWKQVWVTETPFRPGGVKEKALVERTDDGGTVFVGEVTTAAGEVVLDRTKLIPLEDGRVRQLIEYSQDDGATWHPIFDAIYVRAGAGSP